MRKWFNRIFVALVIPVFLITSLAMSVSALSPAIETESVGTKIKPFISGDYLIELDRSDVDHDYGYLAYTGALADWVPVTWDLYEDSSFSKITAISTNIPNIYAYHQNKQSTVVVNGEDQFRIHDKFMVYGYDNAPFFQTVWTFRLDDFGGTWSSDLVNRLFYVEGQLQFTTRFTLWAIDNNGGIVSIDYAESGTANGTQSVMYQARLNNYANRIGLKPGDPFWISDWECSVETVAGVGLTQFEVSRMGAPFGNLAVGGNPVSVWPFQYGSLKDFISQSISGDVPDLDSNDFGGWLASVATSFFDVELFGTFSLGEVATVLFAVGVVFWLLKLFAGG